MKYKNKMILVFYVSIVLMAEFSFWINGNPLMRLIDVFMGITIGYFFCWLAHSKLFIFNREGFKEKVKQ